MGVSSTQNTYTYNGDSSTTAFSYPVEFFETTDLQVYLYDTIAGGIVQQTLGTNYTVSGTQNAQGIYPSGGTVTFGSAPVSTAIVVVDRQPPQVQNFALGMNGLIPSASLVQQFDYLTLLIQGLTDQISRCPQIAEGFGPSFSNVITGQPALQPGYYLTTNANGNGWTLAPGLSPIQTLVESYTSFTGQAGTSYNLPLFTLSEGTLLTYIVIKPTTSWLGGSISGCTASIGVAGNYTQFINAFNVYQAPGGTVYSSIVANYIGSFTSNTQLYLTINTSGGNLSALTQGGLNIYYAFATL